MSNRKVRVIIVCAVCRKTRGITLDMRDEADTARLALMFMDMIEEGHIVVALGPSDINHMEVLN